MKKHNVNILLVEDDFDTREKIATILRRRCQQLFLAENGKSGFSVYQAEKPDIVITDIQMPIMDGLTMANHIRENDPKIPIIIISAFTELSYMMDSIKIGVFSFLQKPVHLPELDIALDRATDAVLQERLIEEQNKLIHSLLHATPFYSIMVKDNQIETMSRHLLGILGYASADDFQSNAENEVYFCNQGEIKEGLHNEKYSWKSFIDLIIKTKDSLPQLCMNRKEMNSDKLFQVRVKYFPNLNSYLIGFFSPDEIQNTIDKTCLNCSALKDLKQWMEQ